MLNGASVVNASKITGGSSTECIIVLYLSFARLYRNAMQRTLLKLASPQLSITFTDSTGKMKGGGDKATERVGRAENVPLLCTKQTILIFHHKWTWISWVNLKSMSLVRWKKFYTFLLISFYISKTFAYLCKYTTKGMSELSNIFELWLELRDWDDKQWKYQAKIFNGNSFLFILTLISSFERYRCLL